MVYRPSFAFTPVLPSGRPYRLVQAWHYRPMQLVSSLSSVRAFFCGCSVVFIDGEEVISCGNALLSLNLRGCSHIT